MWKETIKELVTMGNYTLISYEKGGQEEWCVALRYDPATKTWASGHYSWSLEGALGLLLILNDSIYVKCETERYNGIAYDRLLDIAINAIKFACDNDEDMQYFNDRMALTEDERKFLDVYLPEEDE